ncbi:hypothetical protein [Paraherbaspirillum soli]|uniref:Uncharacterized protein n=1 Tax=Paraherbaspirillum soli TaxID=631222 RepID=A0ABW0M6E6_9BURK
MINHAGPDTNHRSPAERKRQLVQEGAAFRAEMINARNVVRASLNSRSLVTNLFGRVAGIASSLFDKPLNIKPGNLQSLAPLLMAGVSLLSKRGARKTVLIGGGIIAAIAAATYMNSRNATKDDE